MEGPVPYRWGFPKVGVVRSHFPAHCFVDLIGRFFGLDVFASEFFLDLRSAEGKRRLDRLVAGADVLVHNLSVRAADRLGLTDPDLELRHPRLVNWN